MVFKASPSFYRLSLTVPEAYHRLLELVWLDASDEERVAQLQGRHEGLQGLLELGRQGRGPFPGL